MHLKSYRVAALAGLASAATPPGFLPSSTGDLTIAFGSTLATQGIDLPRASTQQQPTIGTTVQLVGTFSIIMVDPDIPPNPDGSSRGQNLHWLQTNLASSNTRILIGGREIFPLVADNTSAIAPYRGPAPPARPPFSHRYISLLVNTTGNQAALTALNTSGQTRLPFNAQTALQSAGLTVLAGGWFNVTNTTTTNGTGGAPSSTGALPTSSSIPANGAAKVISSSGAIIAGLGVVFGLFL